MTKEPEKIVVCNKCNANLTPEQKFCPNCGAAVNTTPKVNKKPFVIGIIKSSLILALALFMLISAFAPIVKIDIDEITGEEVSVGFGTIDGIIMAVSSLAPLDEEELGAASLEIMDEMLGYYEDWEEGEELGKFSTYTKKLLYLSLRSKDTAKPLALIFIVFFSVAQITLAVLLAVFASLSFASVFSSNVKSRHGLSFLFMGLATIVLCANAYAFKFMYGQGDMKLSGIAAFTIVFAILIIVAFFVFRLVFDKARIKVGTIVKHTLSLTFAILLVISAFAPVATAEIKTNFENSEDAKRVSTTVDGSIFSDFTITETEKDSFDELEEKTKLATAKELMSVFANYTTREFKRGDASDANATVYSYLLLAFGAYEYSGVFTLGTVAMILAFACALVVIWQNMHEFATGKRLHISISLSAKITAIVMAVAVLAISIVMSIIVTNNASAADLIYKSKLAYGPILMLISAITMICIPPAEPKKVNVPQAAPATENTAV